MLESTGIPESDSREPVRERSDVRRARMTPSVSVIITTHNRASSVGSAISSVLMQTRREIELLIIDDASTDETAEVVHSFGDPRTIYLRNSVNMGPAMSRNRGIREALGEFVAFLDDDDEWLPEKLDRQLSLLEVSPETGVVYSGRWNVRRGVLPTTSIPSDRGNLTSRLRDANCVGPPSTVVVRRRCLDAAGLFDEELMYGEDWDLYIRLARRCRFDFVSEPLIRYSVHEGNLSRNLADPRRSVEGFLSKHRSELTSSARAYLFLDVGMSECLGGQMGRGRKAFLRAMVESPGRLRLLAHLLLSFLGARIYGRILKERLGRFRMADESSERTA